MNNPIVITLVIRGLLAGLIVCGGLAALYFGYRLFIKGSGLHKDKTEVEVGKVKVALQSVGGVVMATSVAWGFLGYLTVPSYSASNGGVDVKANTLVAKILPDHANQVLSNPDALKQAFTNVYETVPKSSPTVTIDDKTASLDLKNIEVRKGTTELSPEIVVPAVVDGKVTSVTFTASMTNDRNLKFTPKSEIKAQSVTAPPPPH